ncbi:MAG: hypothetical protein A2066_05845 [Bacteroidetes bacterium GWB2_41_8]|nr:MAG: hypothetical protein A2066_05845 [Bacteroidetes bacterium GWB2_41_8]
MFPIPSTGNHADSCSEQEKRKMVNANSIASLIVFMALRSIVYSHECREHVFLFSKPKIMSTIMAAEFIWMNGGK